MKEGIDWIMYIGYLNHFFLQEIVDFDYLEGGSTVNALEII